MEASWNICAQQPIILSKSPNTIPNNGHMTPLMLDALNSSPNSIDNDCNGKQFVIPQRRISGSYETAYLNNQHHQYSVQGSTSTPNSIGPSSGTASPASPDRSTQYTSDSFTHSGEPINVKWTTEPPNYAIDKTPRYCYVFHSQPQSGAISMMSDSTSIISNSSAHSTITVPATSMMPQNSTFTTQNQTFVTVASPYQTNSLPVPTTKQVTIERSSSVPPQNVLVQSSPELKTTDFSSLDNSTTNDQKSKKPKKRKASIVELGEPAKKQVPCKDANRSTTKSTISALTRRRLKTAEKSGEPLEKMHLLLTELTVEDLKIICRKYNLAISGTKSDLLRRLNPIESTIDVEAILLDAMQEEDQRLIEEQPKSVNIKEIANKKLQMNPVMNQIPTVKIPVNTCTTACNGTNQFDVAIRNYLLDHRKQINQNGVPQKECKQDDCSCVHQTTNLQAKNPNFSTTKTIYFAPSTAVMNGQGPKTTVIRVPIGNFNPPMDTNGPNQPPNVLPKKLCKFDTFQCNAPATFSYAEMGSGFTLETTPVKDQASAMPKFLQISVPSTFCTNVKDPQKPVPACLKCKDKVVSEEPGSDELQALISELSIGGQVNNAIENSTLTARILALHQQTIKAQYSKLYSMGKAIGDSQKILQCQQNKIETARKAMSKIKSNKPSSIDSILQKLDIGQLDEQHGRQANELKTIQQNHQQLKSEQEKVTKSEMELQEDIHVEQAVEDVVRLIKSNRKTALLIVQLVHKFQCDRMRELNKTAIKKPEIIAKVCTECDNGQPCVCKNPKSVNKPVENPTVVTIDESDDEFNCNQQKIEEAKKSELDEENVDAPRLANKKKSKATGKKTNKQISMVQRSEHTFEKVMEDIFQTVITSECPLNDTKENEQKDELLLNDEEERCQNSGNPLAKSTSESAIYKSEIQTEKVESHPNSLIYNAQNEVSPHFNNNNIINPSPVVAPKIYESKFEQMSEPPIAFTNQPTTPPIYNYMPPTTIPKTEINSVYSVQTPYSHQPAPYAETRPNNANYHQRRAFLQQKRQTLYEQLEQIERQQLHNEMQNTYICNSIDIDEELANLGDLDVEELYNYDFDQLDANTPIDEPPASVPFNACPPQPVQYMPAYQQFHNHSNPVIFNPDQQPLIQSQQQAYSPRTFQHANSNDFEDILDLIRNGEKNRQPSMDFDDGAQATNAIYQELRLTDQFQPFTPMQELDEMNWNDPLATSEESKQVAVSES